jgi:membrane associated rhomboid family serine protease
MIPIRDDNPTERPAVITVAFIAACVLVFFWQAAHDPAGQERIVYSLGFIPSVLFTDAQLPSDLAVIPPTATLFTSMFLHGGLMHLAGNMLYLWIFGNNVEDAMGHTRFVVFYLLCGIAAAMAQGLPEPNSTIPMIGASGAISGVLGAYLLLHPAARVLVVIPFGFYLHTVHMPAALVLGLWFLLQIISSLAAPAGEGGVAWFAHIGGFVAGMALIPFFRRRGVRLFTSPRGRW